MNLYNNKILQLKKDIYSKEYQVEQIIRSKKFMDDHFAEKIQLSEISKSANLSKFHFIRLFKKHYGVTPNQYLTEKRILEAKKLLASGKSVFEVCAAVGFESTSTFSGLFKKITGTTPTGYPAKKQL
ncbi:MAG: helix-turn-helix transcriptional regulator [Chitinophagaceae bacterium]|nr:helix-turn-helix transcriptional regulator [Chitinophagaceae bacterium]MBX3257586.1 helix-turn-helix transcriptional regulator [Chitinophagaceae bacterium]